VLIFDFVKKGPLLFLSPHPDDVEYGCGGLLSKLKGKIPVYVATLSKNQKNSKNKNLLKEQKESLKILGVPPHRNFIADFITREFSYSRQEICDFLWKLNRKIEPTCVFTPPFDLHQDHQVTYNESLRAFKTKSVIEYDIPRSEKNPTPVLFIQLNKKNLEDKLRALSKYQTYKNKTYFKKSVIRAACQSPGIKVEIPICEAYNPVSIIT